MYFNRSTVIENITQHSAGNEAKKQNLNIIYKHTPQEPISTGTRSTNVNQTNCVTRSVSYGSMLKAAKLPSGIESNSSEALHRPVISQR